jgi:hypothetical protein
METVASLPRISGGKATVVDREIVSGAVGRVAASERSTLADDAVGSNGVGREVALPGVAAEPLNPGTLLLDENLLESGE